MRIALAFADWIGLCLRLVALASLLHAGGAAAQGVVASPSAAAPAPAPRQPASAAKVDISPVPDSVRPSRTVADRPPDQVSPPRVPISFPVIPGMPRISTLPGNPMPGFALPPGPATPPPAASPFRANDPGEDSAYEAGQLLVLWGGEDEATAGIALLLQNYQIAPSQRYRLDNLGATVALFVLPSGRAAVDLRDRLRSDQPDWVVDLNARAGPLQAPAPRLYAQKMLGVPPSPTHWGPALAGVRVGVIDTGVSASLTHTSALNGSVVVVRQLVEPVELQADPSHGNAVLQLIAGAPQANNFAGAGPPAELFWVASMRDIAGKPSTNSLLLAQALDWLVGQGVTLINMSLGGNGDAILRSVVMKVLALNITIVAASGNNPASSAKPVFPAAYSGVWAATAVDASGELFSGATRARYTLLAAPGAQVWVPTPRGGEYVSGTSYAAALATAALAWWPPSFWELGAAQRAERICMVARKLPQSPYVGCGLVQGTGFDKRQ